MNTLADLPLFSFGNEDGDHAPAPVLSARARIASALRFISSRCDNAHQRDKNGFNKSDSSRGKAWAALLGNGSLSQLSHRDYRQALAMLRKYHRQLNEGNMTLPETAELEQELASLPEMAKVPCRKDVHCSKPKGGGCAGTAPVHPLSCSQKQQDRSAEELPEKPSQLPPAAALCLRGSRLYHDHLKKQKKGCSEIAVHEITVVDAEEHLVSFRLAKKISELDAVSIRYRPSEAVWSVGPDFAINEYDSDHNLLLLTVHAEKVFELLIACTTEDVRVASDLLFLVKRVQEWYEHYGHTVALPRTAPRPLDRGALPLLEGATPSAEQARALETVLQEPFSYVWGAPGTGKTQLVLAYAIIGLLQSRRKIAVFAPTNNALEQVLRGLLAMTDKAGISRSRIMRIGSPSRVFAHAYPELCESRAISKHTEEIDALVGKITSCIDLRTGEVQKSGTPSQLLSMVADDYAQTDMETLKAERKRLRDMKRTIRKSKLHDRLHGADIIAATLDGYIGRLVKEHIAFDHVFIDEAGYASIVKILPALSMGCPVTLLGDHLQLPPVCEIGDEEMRAHEDLQDTFIWAQSGIHAESLFALTHEDAFQAYLKNSLPIFDALKRVILTRTYRFGTNLAAVLDEYVYRIGFTGAAEGTTELLFIDAPGEQPQPQHAATRKASRENAAEAEAIKSWIKIKKPCNAVVLAPYTAQVRLLGDMLPEYRRDQKILTVHGSQGREWDDVILSVVDIDRLWFTDSKNKRSRGLNLINTAVSRARKRLIIVCNRSWWLERRGQLIRALLLAGEEAGTSPFREDELCERLSIGL